jgi:predicted DCC family thiol-disulfide oxidoreductase YuxK
VNDLDEVGGRLLVIYDGHCGLCNRSVRWSLARDRADRLRFVASDSPKVAGLLARHGFIAEPHQEGPGSILVVRNAGRPTEQLLLRSDAIVALLGEMPSPWPALAVWLRLAPRPLRDLGYRLVARSRYRIWGRLATCPIPTAQERGRFL